MVQVAQTWAMAERVRVREITSPEGNKLLGIVRRGSGSVVRWRRAQVVLWSAQGMDVPAIAKIAFTSEDRVREVIHNFNTDGFDSLAPKYAGGRPPKFTLPERQAIKKVALSRPQDHNLPFSTWSLSKLAEFLVAEGVVDDISHEGLRVLLREEGVSFQVIKTWKQSNDPDFEAKKNRILELYAIADGTAQPGEDDPTVVIKRELLRIPFYGWMAWKAGVISIDRSGRAPTLKRMVQEARSAIAEGRAILIFPEGHRMRPGAPPEYKAGVAALYSQLDVSCVPVALNSGLFWTGPAGFLKKPGRIVVQFLDPIPSGLRPREFLQKLETRIETATATLLKEGYTILSHGEGASTAEHAARPRA